MFGVSTPFAHWGFNLVRLIIEAISGSTVSLHITSLEELREGFARRDGASVVVTSDFPDAQLSSFVCSSELPLIAFSDDPRDTVDWTIKSRHMNGFDAARFSSRLFSAIELPLTTERTLLIPSSPNQTAEAVVTQIVSHIFPGRGEWLAVQTFKHLIESGQIADNSIPDRGQYRAAELVDMSPSSAEDSAAINRVVDCYSDLMFGRKALEFDWPLEFFTRPDKRAPRAAFDLTGPARVLFYGPYLHLPVGHWVARTEFEIDGAVSGVEAMTDIYINEVVTEKTFEMPEKGIFAYNLSFRVDDPHFAVQIRLFIKKSAIEGVFLPRSVRVRPGL